MNKLTVAFGLLAAFTLMTGCGDSAAEVTGTLPVVTGIAVDTLNSRGDTLIVTWVPLDSTLVDGYFLWARCGLEGAWTLASTSETSPGVHIADEACYYTVTAFNEDDTSADIGISDNARTDALYEIRQEFSGRPIGFRIDVGGDSLIAGDPTTPEFNQDFVVAFNANLERYVYPGTAKPELWPGGARTQIATRGGYVAPPTSEPAYWRDSLLYGGNFFIGLDSNYYCLLSGSQTLPDTTSLLDTLVIDGQIQPIRGVRVFNRN